ncbi:MAG TPA: DM13 domain-containing protein [Candidatus Limnocylindria bacterium]|nr:DM13 domain-containing protein [Candidatus Limnocylindria bacterium]
MIGTLKRSRPAQAALALVLLVGGAFAWWTISPLFLTTTLNEDLPARTASATPGATATSASTAASTAAPAGPKVLATGQLQRVDDLHRGTGPVSLVELDGKTYLRFENVAIQNGPDLHVYLGRGMGGAYDGNRDLYLGALKATNGSFNYELPAGTATGDYKSVVVWCRAFTVLFTWADLR